ncbi:hypothetical protein AB9P05_00850 [Roseivirga sp. BDSF3-8]
MAKSGCQDFEGEYDKLNNYGYFSSGDGGWECRCYIQFNYYAFGF